jgi:Fic/DOC family N-terminal
MATPTKPNNRIGTYVTRRSRCRQVRRLPSSHSCPYWTKQTKPSDAWTGLGRYYLDPSLFIYPYVRKEAVLSSQIEGTPLEIVENLAKLNLSKMAKGIFSAKKRKVELLEAELKAAGRECAYVFDAQERSER